MNVNHRQRRRFGVCLAVVAALTSGTALADIYVGKGVESGVSATRRLEVVVEATPFTMTAEDRRLTELAVQRLRDDELIQGRIAVSAIGGVVMLSGGVRSVPMIYRAVEVLRDLDAVRAVDVDELDRDSRTVWNRS
ncbi:MAG: BON domain-containing protein [Pseudomonadota bacterium]|jgi:osmotically-inducible protein OsmY|nr:BON domain-containing protein [Pseudomonadota bacterium]